jgi:O-antigen ligase
MSIAADPRRLPRGLPVSWSPLIATLAPAVMAATTLLTVAAVVFMGYWALALPVYVAMLVFAIVAPRAAAIVIAAMLIAVEPGAFDVTKPLSLFLYFGPPGFAEMMPLTISPAEVGLIIAGIGLAPGLRAAPRPQDRPWILMAVPLVIFLGIAYGLYRGAESNFAYHEARGLLFAMAAFVVAPAADTKHRRLAFGLFLVATLFLALTTIARYLMYVRFGVLPVAQEAAFSHDSVIYMALAVGMCSYLLFRSEPGTNKWLLGGILLVTLVAVFMTGRRSGTLMMLVCGATFLAFTFPRRPALVALLSVVLLVGGSAYVAAFWNKEYGTSAQPARAIRSQIDPSARDDSSDIYRDIERYNLVQTIRANRVFGIGFGNQFGQYVSLPDLTSVWPLQFYTPHQNILWLWLKLGIAGISVMMAVFMAAMARCLRTVYRHPLLDDTWTTAAVVGSGLLMFLMFSTVDVVLPATRGMVILGVLMALAFGLPGAARREAEPT